VSVEETIVELPEVSLIIVRQPNKAARLEGIAREAITLSIRGQHALRFGAQERVRVLEKEAHGGDARAIAIDERQVPQRFDALDPELERAEQRE
jgi:hypothetical protein